MPDRWNTGLVHTVCYGVRGIEGTVLEKDLPEDYQRMIIEGTVLKYPRTTNVQHCLYLARYQMVFCESKVKCTVLQYPRI